MKNPSALWRSLLFGRNGRLKHRLAAVGGQKKPPLSWRVFILSDPGAIRTRDRLLRRQMLYPAELRDRGRKNRAGIGRDA
jgi:hypothetical protein